jgi:hypothetical protein
VVAGALVIAAGCASAPVGTAELAPLRLHNAQTGANERCGIEMIREVQRANDLTWAERIGYTWSARAEARRAVQDEEQWRQKCVERFRQKGFEVVAAPAAR